MLQQSGSRNHTQNLWPKYSTRFLLCQTKNTIQVKKVQNAQIRQLRYVNTYKIFHFAQSIIDILSQESIMETSYSPKVPGALFIC